MSYILPEHPLVEEFAKANSALARWEIAQVLADDMPLRMRTDAYFRPTEHRSPSGHIYRTHVDDYNSEHLTEGRVLLRYS